jgi:hypothetical protein
MPRSYPKTLNVESVVRKVLSKDLLDAICDAIIFDLKELRDLAKKLGVKRARRKIDAFEKVRVGLLPEQEGKLSGTYIGFYLGGRTGVDVAGLDERILANLRNRLYKAWVFLDGKVPGFELYKTPEDSFIFRTEERQRSIFIKL